MGALISAPLSMAATCGGSLLGSCCASMACKACSCACTLTQRVSSFVYLGLVYIFLIAAYTFKYQGGPIVIGGSTNATESSILDKMRHAAMDQTVGQISDRWNSNFWCAPRYPTGIIICCEDVCGGDFAVYRFSFTLCVFFAAMTLLCAGTSKLGARTHRGFWFLKAFVVFALLVSTLFISNETLVGYREAARYLSVLFLLMQILLLIDFGYTLCAAAAVPAAAPHALTPALALLRLRPRRPPDRSRPPQQREDDRTRRRLRVRRRLWLEDGDHRIGGADGSCTWGASSRGC